MSRTIMEDSLIQPTDYLIKSVKIKANRYDDFLKGTNYNGYELNNVIVEVNLFESLDRPYLTGNLTFLDNMGLADTLNFSGTERVEIDLASDRTTDMSGKNYIRKHFIVTGVVNTGKSNDDNEIIILHLVEERCYQSTLMSLNKVYKAIDSRGGFNQGGSKGTAIEIMQNILMEMDQYKVNSNYVFHNQLAYGNIEPNFDGSLKIVVPNLHPLEAIKWIADRCVTTKGYPFFIFASMADDKIRFLDLESILKSPPMNMRQSPYIYSQALLHSAHTVNTALQSFLIHEYKSDANESQMMFNESGAGPAEFNFVDTFQGTVHVMKHNPGETFSRAQLMNIIPRNDVPVYDAKAVFGDKNIGQYTSRRITNITTTRTYSNSNISGDDQQRSYNEYIDPSNHNLKVTAKSLKAYLHKSKIIIKVPGRNFISKDTNLTVGNRIRVEFRKNHPENTSSLSSDHDAYDIKKSGDYIIYSAKHTFSPGAGSGFTSTLELTKLSHTKK